MTNGQIDELKKAIESNVTEDIKAKLDSLTEEFNKLAQKIYQETAQEQAAQEGQPQDAGAEEAEDVVDAEYEVVDDDEESQS